MNKYKYPLGNAPINNNDIDMLVEWLKTYPRLTMGPLTQEVEKDWANYVGTERSIFLNSGSSANLMMVYLGIISGKLKKGDKVIVPACGWATTIAPVMQFGLEPIMIDANKYNFGMDIEKINEICTNEDVKGMIYVHVLGVPNDKDEIKSIKDNFDLFLMEDCCASVGAKYSDGTKIGTLGDVSSFSFYFGHQLSTIEGGFVNTDNEEYYQTMLMLRSHGWTKDVSEEKYNEISDKWNIDKINGPFNFITTGFNLRATDLQAFLGIEQIKKADEVMQLRNRNHERYVQNMQDKFVFQKWNDSWPVSLHIGILAQDSNHRKSVLEKCEANGIETRVWSHGNLGRHPFWKDHYGAFENVFADQIYERGFILPTYPELSLEDIDFISNICNDV